MTGRQMVIGLLVWAVGSVPLSLLVGVIIGFGAESSPEPVTPARIAVTEEAA